MTIVLNKNVSQEEILKIVSRLRNAKRKGFNAKKYSGILKLSKDPLSIQKKLRNEWR